LSAARRLFLVIPGDLATRTGGYLYDRRLARELGARGWRVEPVSLPANFPFPGRDDLASAAAALAGVPAGAIVLVDGLALGAMPAVAAQASARLTLIGLVHHPLCLETGLTEAQAADLAASERAALATARAVIVTSPRTAASLVDLMDVPAERITVAVPGTDPAPLARRSTDGEVRLLCVGTVTARKGHRVLVEALSGVDGPWELACAGALDRDAATAAALRADIRACGLGDRVHLLGELGESDLAELYSAADLFVSASFHEGYGMALAEALARGIPIVAAAGGAVAETVPPGAGLLVPPGDVAALRTALRRFMAEPSLAERLRAGSMAARAGLPTWQATADRVEQVLRAVAG
jgi:glycosyltransferase involved in cell wall biosynthesis